MENRTRYDVYVMHPEKMRKDLGLPLVTTNKFFAEVGLPAQHNAFFYKISTTDRQKYPTKASFVQAVAKAANQTPESSLFECKLEEFVKNNNLDVAIMSPVGRGVVLSPRPIVNGNIGQLRKIKRKQRDWSIWNPALLPEYAASSTNSPVALSYSPVLLV